MRRHQLVIVIVVLDILLAGLLFYEFGSSAALIAIMAGVVICLVVEIAVPVMNWTAKVMGLNHWVYVAFMVLFVAISIGVGGIRFGGSYVAELKNSQGYIEITQNRNTVVYELHTDGEFGVVDSSHHFVGIGKITSTSVNIYNGPEYSIVFAVKPWTSLPIFAVAPREYPIMLEFSN